VRRQLAEELAAIVGVRGFTPLCGPLARSDARCVAFCPAVPAAAMRSP
jgi:hypothetical protein